MKIIFLFLFNNFVFSHSNISKIEKKLKAKWDHLKKYNRKKFDKINKHFEKIALENHGENSKKNRKSI